MDTYELLELVGKRNLIEMISPYFFSIIYMVVIFVFIARFKRRVKNNVRNRRTGTAASVGSSGLAGNSANTGPAVKKPVTNTVSRKIPVSKVSDKSMTLMDDRSSDWLARQLKEEEYAMLRVSDMFQLKREHANKCDAEFIKRFHESNCDANGIDDGMRK